MAGLAALGTVALVGSLTSCSSSHPPLSAVDPALASASASAAAAATASASADPSPTVTPPRRGSGTPIQVSLFEADGETWGVGMPIIAYFSVAPTDASVFDKVTQVTVNGKPAAGAWYFEQSSRSDEAMEAHYRLASYWPGHSVIKLNLPIGGLWAGAGLVFSDSLTLTMHTGAAHIVKVNGKPGVDQMLVYSDGKLIRKVSVSLGAATTPTYLGTAVAMGKANPELMVSAPGEPYYRIEVPWSVRMTYDGEFLHDAYWNDQLGQVNLSHGCTNMSPTDAQWYYNWSLVGDPVSWVNTGTRKVLPVTDGWGDWNISFAAYAKGGLLAP